jgi:hypothetical protein
MENTERALSVGRRSTGDEELVNALWRQAEFTAKVGLRAVYAQMGAHGEHESIPHRRVRARPQRGIARRPGARDPAGCGTGEHLGNGNQLFGSFSSKTEARVQWDIHGKFNVLRETFRATQSVFLDLFCS